MDEERFNLELRKFLKKVGISCQRDIEMAVRDAIASGALSGSETLRARMVLDIEGVELHTEIDGEIGLA